MAKNCKIVFQPSGRRGIFPCGTNLLTTALELGEPIESLCGGKGSRLSYEKLGRDLPGGIVMEVK